MPSSPWFGRALAAALLGVLATGCGDSGSPYFGTTERTGKDRKTFYANNGGEPEYLDPGMAHDTASSIPIYQMFEGLTVYDAKDTHPVQGMATSWDQSDDNRHFRFHLRPDAKWSDGKPVTAHDFEYAWKRVLRPATGSLSASNLYPLKNGELFNQSKLKVLKRELELRSAPRDDATAVAKLPKGTAVRILGRSPMKVASAIAPLAAVPEVKLVTFSKAEAKKKTPEQLSFGAARPPAGPAADGGWNGADVVVLGRAGEVDCNDGPDFWYEIARGEQKGFLPGCMLAAAKSDKSYALVAAHPDLPTFKPAAPVDPAAPPPAETAKPPEGFVELGDLAEDDSVVGVRAADDLTLEVELQQPTPYFTDLTSHTTLCPVRRDVIEKWAKAGKEELWVRPENIITNGPYTLDEWKFRYEITMKRNPYYYDKDKLRFERIVFMEIEEYHSTMNLYKAGDMDFIGDNAALPAEYLSFLKTKKDFQQFYYLSTYWYEFNTKKPPVDDVRVRRALNLAIDKQQLVDKVTRGGQLPASHYVPDFTGLGYSDQVKADRDAGIDPFATPDAVHNPERARALLKEAGYEVVKDGDGYRATGFPPLEILYNTSEVHKQIAVAIQDMWKRHLGVSATIRNEEWKVMLKNVRDGNFHVVRFGWTADYNHPHTWLDTLLSQSPQNHTGWADKQYDEMLKKAASTADPKESIKLYRAAELRAVEGMAKLPLYFYTKSTLVKPWVKGFTGNGRNVHLMKWFWIDDDWRNNPSNEPAYPSVELPPPGRLAP